MRTNASAPTLPETEPHGREVTHGRMNASKLPTGTAPVYLWRTRTVIAREAADAKPRALTRTRR